MSVVQPRRAAPTDARSASGRSQRSIPPLATILFKRCWRPYCPTRVICASTIRHPICASGKAGSGRRCRPPAGELDYSDSGLTGVFRSTTSWNSRISNCSRCPLLSSFCDPVLRNLSGPMNYSDIDCKLGVSKGSRERRPMGNIDSGKENCDAA